MARPFTARDLSIGEAAVQRLHGLKGYDAWAECIAKIVAAARSEAPDGTQRSVTLGLVAAKIAIAEIEGSRSFKTPDQAFAAIRDRLNEMTKDAVKAETH